MSRFSHLGDDSASRPTVVSKPGSNERADRSAYQDQGVERERTGQSIKTREWRESGQVSLSTPGSTERADRSVYQDQGVTRERTGQSLNTRE